eukprot:TRINITY_DN768_c0_g1_i1.p1 TRINITY_DN768_c0_g1~~TRINITY_DN768_c0_g1_i1.p1  ORF type:complete len:376 (-),score=71.77 TRINITY_DN768_c0_g1_i1:258-1271(-)
MGDHAHLDTLYNSLPKLMGLNEQEERILRHTITLCKEENKSALLKESFSQLFNEEIGKIQVAAKLLESIPMSGPLTTEKNNQRKPKTYSNNNSVTPAIPPMVYPPYPSPWNPFPYSSIYPYGTTGGIPGYPTPDAYAQYGLAEGYPRKFFLFFSVSSPRSPTLKSIFTCNPPEKNHSHMMQTVITNYHHRHIHPLWHHRRYKKKKIVIHSYTNTLAPSNLGGPHLGPDEVLSENTLYVRNLPATLSTEEIKTTFSKYGPIEEVRLQTNKETGQFFGSAFVEYIHASAARLARLQMDNKPFQDKTIHIEFAKEKKLPKSTKKASPSWTLNWRRVPLLR